jgi:hypothetical protein
MASTDDRGLAAAPAGHLTVLDANPPLRMPDRSEPTRQRVENEPLGLVHHLGGQRGEVGIGREVGELLSNGSRD